MSGFASRSAPAIYNAESGSGVVPGRRNFLKVCCQPGWLGSHEDQVRMKKIVLVLFLLAGFAAAGRAQESRQDVSLSGIALIPPFVASSTNVQVHSNTGYGILASYRFMLTPNSALEANYGVTYQNQYTYVLQTLHIPIQTRTQEISGAFVRSFTFTK